VVDDPRQVRARRRLVDVDPGGDVPELGDPAPDVRTVGIVAAPLERRVEDPEVGLGIGPRRGGPLPAAVVARRVAVDKMAMKWASPTRQSTSRCFVRNEATIIRARLCIQPVARS
jgi:hypothetical protein